VQHVLLNSHQDGEPLGGDQVISLATGASILIYIMVYGHWPSVQSSYTQHPSGSHDI